MYKKRELDQIREIATDNSNYEKYLFAKREYENLFEEVDKFLITYNSLLKQEKHKEIQTISFRHLSTTMYIIEKAYDHFVNMEKQYGHLVKNDFTPV